MKKEDKSLIDVENVETTGERCCHLGSFKCYVTQWGWGCQLSRKKCYEDVRFNVISVTRGWMGVKFPEKNRYVTLELHH